MAWSTVNQSDGPSSLPTCCARSFGYSTVSVLMSSLLAGEALALVGQAVEQGGGLPHVAVLALPLPHAIADGLEPEGVGPEHGSAPVHGPAVAVHPDDVDVAGPDGQLLLEDLGPLIDHRVEQALEDLLVGDEAPDDAHVGRDLGDDLFHLGVRLRRAVAPLVAVVAGPRLLAEATHLAQAISHRRLHALALADAPAHVEAGHVAHGEGAHGKAEVVEDLVHLLGQGALQDELLRLAPALVEHAVAHEAVADADQHRHLGDLPAHAHGRGDDGLRGLGPAHDLEQAHDVGRAEEVGADHALGAPGGRGDLVDVQGGGVRGQHRAGFGDAVELGEDLLLDGHLLEDGLHDHVGVGHRAEVGGARDQPHALLDVVLGEAAPRGGGLVVLPDDAEAAVERLARDLHHGHGDARVGEVHGDAATHGAGPDDCRLLDGQGWRVAG